MIAANGVTAAYLERRGFPSLRRVLRSPDRWERIVALAAATGDRLPPQADARALEAFLERRRAADPVRFPDLSLAVVKLLGRGEYVLRQPGEDVVGHFGLAVRDYTHSTAPNRRFPDLATQRLLKAALAGEAAPYRLDELSALGVPRSSSFSRIPIAIGASASASPPGWTTVNPGRASARTIRSSSRPSTSR